MKNILILFLLFNSLVFAENKGETVYQVSTIDALLAGYYDGNKTVEDIKENGDFGLGTFNGIDGEMIVLNGSVYQVKSTGKILEAKDNIGVPFATVHFFKSDIDDTLQNITSYKDLQNKLNSYKECKNYPCGFKIEGTFSYIKTRSEPKASKPYLPLAKHIGDNQTFFETNNVQGILIGYYLPKYFAKLNVPGYHFHFLSDDKKFGGHVLSVAVKNTQLYIDKLYNVKLALLKTKEFEKATLQVADGDLEKVEKDIPKEK